ncbi:MAG: hypothetical protein WDO19_17620 [Bacteroidota bacterium]
MRGKVISIEKFLSVAEKGFGFCDVVFGWDAADVAYDNAKITGWHTGYPIQRQQWMFKRSGRYHGENDLPFFLADFSGADSSVKAICPANLIEERKKAGGRCRLYSLFLAGV